MLVTLSKTEWLSFAYLSHNHNGTCFANCATRSLAGTWTSPKYKGWGRQREKMIDYRIYSQSFILHSVHTRWNQDQGSSSKCAMGDQRLTSCPMAGTYHDLAEICSVVVKVQAAELCCCSAAVKVQAGITLHSSIICCVIIMMLQQWWPRCEAGNCCWCRCCWCRANLLPKPPPETSLPSSQAALPQVVTVLLLCANPRLHMQNFAFSCVFSNAHM